jgi:hypothetical protein
MERQPQLVYEISSSIFSNTQNSLLVPRANTRVDARGSSAVATRSHRANGS